MFDYHFILVLLVVKEKKHEQKKKKKKNKQKKNNNNKKKNAKIKAANKDQRGQEKNNKLAQTIVPIHIRSMIRDWITCYSITGMR